MPIYEYHCKKCGQDFEELVTSKDKSIACPHCTSRRTEKLMSAFSVKSSGGGGSAASAGSSCAGCSSKNCSTCH